MISLEYYADKLTEIQRLAIPERVIDPDSEPVFNVNLNTRKIDVPDEFYELAAYGDHLAETIWFAFDRYFDGTDLSGKKVGIQYINALGQTGMLPANFASVEKKVLLIGWTIPYEVTCATGKIKLSLRFYELEGSSVIYNLGTEPVELIIKKGMYVSSESEGVNPDRDSLSQLVDRIEELYINNSMQTINYEQASNKPSINDVTLVKKLYTNYEKAQSATAPTNDSVTNHHIKISYNDLYDLPQINGIELQGNKTDAALGIKVEVDANLNETSTNPIQNKVVTAAVSSIQTNIESLMDSVGSLWEELDGMTFIPLSIDKFYHTYGYAEKGSTVNEITLKWILNGTPLLVTIDGTEVSLASQEITLSDLEIKDNKVFKLQAKDKKGNVANAETELYFGYKVFHGAFEEPQEYNDDFLNQLQNVIQLNRKSTINVKALENQYIFYAVPSSYGTCIFTSGGFTGGFTKVATISYTNEYKVTTNYDIWKSDYAGLGETSVIIS